MVSVAARARASPVAPPPYRVTWRMTSWLLSTQVGLAPTVSRAAKVPVITSAKAVADQSASSQEKLKAWLISSERTNRAIDSGVWVHASATSIRSPG